MSRERRDQWGELIPPVQHDLNHIDRWTNHCDTTTTRDGEEQPCGKTAVAAISMWFEGEWVSWAVCAYHAHMMGGRDDCELIPLRYIVRGHV